MQQLFSELGFTENEQKLYMLLLETGKAPANLLAKRAKVPRTTAYSVLQALVQRGLISEEKKETTTVFVANQPSAIVRLVNDEKKALLQKAHHAEELARLLTPFYQSKGINIPRMQFFEGRASVESMLYDFTDEWITSCEKYDSVMWGYQDAIFVGQYLTWLEHYWGKMRNTQVCLFSNIKPSEVKLKGKVRGRTIKPLGENHDFSSSVWVVGDFIVVLQTRNTPHYAFHIQDRALSGNLRFIYKTLWQGS